MLTGLVRVESLYPESAVFGRLWDWVLYIFDVFSLHRESAFCRQFRTACVFQNLGKFANLGNLAFVPRGCKGSGLVILVILVFVAPLAPLVRGPVILVILLTQDYQDYRSSPEVVQVAKLVQDYQDDQDYKAPPPA